MRRAFTLIELLVTINIMALLAAVLLPVLGMASDAAGLVRCEQRASQIGHGLLGYAQDHHGLLPGDLPSTGAPDQMWTQLVKRFVDDQADLTAPARFFADPAMGRCSPLTAFWHSNYALNLYAACRWDSATWNWGYGPTRLAQIAGPGGTMLLLGGMRVDGRVISEWHLLVPGSDGQERFVFPHRGRRDAALFADLHAGMQAFAGIPRPADYAAAMADDYWSMER